eukprot:6456484-Prymnesium_polylepis.1
MDTTVLPPPKPRRTTTSSSPFAQPPRANAQFPDPLPFQTPRVRTRCAHFTPHDCAESMRRALVNSPQ